MVLRPSVLDAHMDKVGILPDAEVGKIVGVSAENVRAYRKRRAIPARWRTGEAPDADPVAVEPAAVEPEPAKKKPAKKKSAKAAKTVKGGKAARRAKAPATPEPAPEPEPVPEPEPDASADHPDTIAPPTHHPAEAADMVSRRDDGDSADDTPDPEQERA
jgi:hypothetical protein